MALNGDKSEKIWQLQSRTLSMQALNLFRQKTGSRQHLKVRLEKTVPLGEPCTPRTIVSKPDLKRVHLTA